MIGRGGWRTETGIALIEAVIGLTILALVITTVSGVFISGIAQAKTASVRGEAAAWTRSELDYLRYLGYASACLNQGARTITPESPPCTPLEPRLPADLAQATIVVEHNVERPGLKRITIDVAQAPPAILLTVVTYETQFL